MAETTAILVAQQLVRAFGAHRVLGGVDLSLGVGAHALLGGNGVGKTTLLAALSGAGPADSGRVTVCGHAADSLAARRLLAAMPDPAQVYPFVSGRDLLGLVLAARGLPDDAAAPLLRGLHLDGQELLPFGQLSEGTRRKFCVACALLGEARLVLLDEPTSSLDQASIDYLGDALAQRAERDCIVFATHDEMLVRRLRASVTRLPLPGTPN